MPPIRGRLTLALAWQNLELDILCGKQKCREDWTHLCVIIPRVELLGLGE